MFLDQLYRYVENGTTEPRSQNPNFEYPSGNYGIKPGNSSSINHPVGEQLPSPIPHLKHSTNQIRSPPLIQQPMISSTSVVSSNQSPSAIKTTTTGILQDNNQQRQQRQAQLEAEISTLNRYALYYVRSATFGYKTVNTIADIICVYIYTYKYLSILE